MQILKCLTFRSERSPKVWPSLIRPDHHGSNNSSILLNQQFERMRIVQMSFRIHAQVIIAIDFNTLFNACIPGMPFLDILRQNAHRFVFAIGLVFYSVQEFGDVFRMFFDCVVNQEINVFFGIVEVLDVEEEFVKKWSWLLYEDANNYLWSWFGEFFGEVDGAFPTSSALKKNN